MSHTRLVVCAPFAGRVLVTEDLPDPVFAGRMMGEGITMQPHAPAANSGGAVGRAVDGGVGGTLCGVADDAADDAVNDAAGGTSAGGAALQVLAPISGRITSRWQHAAIIAPPDTGVLVHLGLDTVGLKGEGFQTLRDTDEDVACGEAIKTWDLSVAEARGLNTAVPIVLICPAKPQPEVTVLVEPGQDVTAGQEIITVTFAS